MLFRSAHTRFYVHWDPAQSSDFIGPWARPNCGSWSVSWEGGGWLWLTVGARTLVAEAKGILIGMSSPRGCHFGTETWPHPIACRLQCGDASGQTTSRGVTQPHPSVDRLLEVVLSSQVPLNIPFDTALPTSGTRPSSTLQWAGTSPSHQEACRKPLHQPHTPGARHQQQEELRSCSPWKGDHKHSKFHKMR